MEFSIILPTYRCSAFLEELSERLTLTLKKFTDDFEIVFVNDNSPENDWEIIVNLSEKHSHIKGLNFSKNFGQHYAITCGMEYSTGDYVIIMDADLQDLPEELPKLVQTAKSGNDIVLARRINRKDNFIKRNFSILYYHFLSILTETRIDHTVGTYRLLTKQVCSEYLKMKETSRFFGAMINWLGFKVAYVDVIHSERTNGKGSYSLRKAINLAITGVISFSDKPLRLTIKLGITFLVMSSIFIIYKIIILLLYGTGSSSIGWSSIIASIFFCTGIIISVLGVIGLYLGKIFEQVKNRPLYIIKDKTKNI